MDTSSNRWISELDIDDYNMINQCDISTFDEFNTDELTELEESFMQSFSSDANSTTTFSSSPNGWNSNPTDKTQQNPSVSSPSQFFSFENPNSPPTNHGNLNAPLNQKEVAPSHGDMNFTAWSKSRDPNVNKGMKRSYAMTKTPSQAQDHIMAERKRREKLSQRFIALSAIVPGLKKMDKATVLADAIKYIKQLQDTVKLLEEQSKKKTMESVVYVKKSQLSADDETSSSDESFDVHQSSGELPEIEAKVSEKSVLLRIHCDIQKGFLVKILSEIEKLHLTIVNSSVLPFGNSTLDITIIAQMDPEFCMTVKDLVKSLRVALLKFT